MYSRITQDQTTFPVERTCGRSEAPVEFRVRLVDGSLISTPCAFDDKSAKPFTLVTKWGKPGSMSSSMKKQTVIDVSKIPGATEWNARLSSIHILADLPFCTLNVDIVKSPKTITPRVHSNSTWTFHPSAEETSSVSFRTASNKETQLCMKSPVVMHQQTWNEPSAWSVTSQEPSLSCPVVHWLYCRFIFEGINGAFGGLWIVSWIRLLKIYSNINKILI